jgi:hypothetical protein
MIRRRCGGKAAAVDARRPNRQVSGSVARLTVAVTAALSFSALAILAPSAEAAKQTKPLRIMDIHNTGFGQSQRTVFTARAPRGWKVVGPRDCTAVGYDSAGAKEVGKGNGGYGRNAKLSFDRGVVVTRSNLSVRCPTLRHKYYTTSYETRWSRRYKSVHGASTSSRGATRGCRIHRTYGGLILDCWGGKHAVATYSFHLPADARGIHQWAHGSRGCCRNGRVYKGWSRSGGHVTYRVTVTHWASYTVKKVGVNYLTKVRRKVRHKHVEYAVGKGSRA